MSSPKIQNKQQKSSGSTITSSTTTSANATEFDIEKYREEGNWRQCLKIAEKNTEHRELQNFLIGEALLELYLEDIYVKKSHGDSKSIKWSNNNENDLSNSLRDAKSCLHKCLEGNDETPLIMDANLLLAKAYFVSKDYAKTLNYIQQSGIDSIMDIDRNLPLRVIKLIAESFTVKGLAMEKLYNSAPLKYIDLIEHSDDDQSSVENHSLPAMSSFELNESNKMKMECLQKACILTLRYIHSIVQQRGPYTIVTLGIILDNLLHETNHIILKNGSINESINFCRRILNICETNSTLNLRQQLSKELAEILIKSCCRSVWYQPNPSKKQHSNPPIYYGNSLFIPSEYEEEIMLLLMLSEALASSNVLLERNSEFLETRIKSLNQVLLIQDLFTHFFIPNQCYYIDLYERSMKFSYECKHVWFQFALTLMESKKSPMRSYLLLKQVIRMDPKDPLPCMIAAKICITDLYLFNDAINILEDALKRVNKCLNINQSLEDGDNEDVEKNNDSIDSVLINNVKEIYGKENLKHIIYLWLGIAYASLYESNNSNLNVTKNDDSTNELANETNLAINRSWKSENKIYQSKSIEYFRKSIEFDLYGNDYLPYYHLALHMANERTINDALKYIKIALLLNPNHLPSIQLFILCLTALKHYEQAYDVCLNCLQEYESNIILLYIKANLERVLFLDNPEQSLLTAKEMLKQWRLILGEANRRLSPRVSYCSYIPSATYDSMSLRMEQALSEVVSIGSTGRGAGAAANSNVAPPINDLSFGQLDRLYLSQTSSGHSMADGSNDNFKQFSYAFEMQIWQLIVELFLQLDQVNEAKSCVYDEMMINSSLSIQNTITHQLMYLKGLIHIKQQNYHDAKTFFQNSLALKPNHMQALQCLGLIYHRLGNQELAEKYLKDALIVDSTCPQTWSYLGSVYDSIKNYGRASTCHLTSIFLHSTCPLISFSVMSRHVFD